MSPPCPPCLTVCDVTPGPAAGVACASRGDGQAGGLTRATRRGGAATERMCDGETGVLVPDDEAYANGAMLLLTTDSVLEGRSRDARAHQRGRGWDDAAAEFEVLFK